MLCIQSTHILKYNKSIEESYKEYLIKLYLMLNRNFDIKL